MARIDDLPRPAVAVLELVTGAVIAAGVVVVVLATGMRTDAAIAVTAFAGVCDLVWLVRRRAGHHTRSPRGVKP